MWRITISAALLLALSIGIIAEAAPYKPVTTPWDVTVGSDAGGFSNEAKANALLCFDGMVFNAATNPRDVAAIHRVRAGANFVSAYFIGTDIVGCECGGVLTDARFDAFGRRWIDHNLLGCFHGVADISILVTENHLLRLGRQPILKVDRLFEEQARH